MAATWHTCSVRILPVADLHHADLLDYSRLTDVALRRKLEPAGGLYLAESAKVIARALAAGHVPRSLLTDEKFLPQAEALLAKHPDVPVYVAPAAALEELTGFRMHRGVLAAMHRPPLPTVAEVVAGARTVLVLDDLVDHTNVGAAFRGAAGLGADAVLVSAECADPLYRRAVRVSMGTVLQVPWTRLPAWGEAARMLHAAGFEIAALALAAGAVPLREYARTRPEKVALVLGSEGHGLSRRAMSLADRIVTIPMLHGVDSLNAAAASAVALYALQERPQHPAPVHHAHEKGGEDG